MPVEFLTDEQEAKYSKYNGDPTPEQLSKYFWLDDNDRVAVFRHRGDHNCLSFALQLGTDTSLQIPFDIREKIVKLVRYHGLPLFFLEKPNPQKAVILASQSVRMDWLVMLAKADAQGRTCNDQNDLIDRVNLFNDFCEENGCIKSPRIFPNNYSRYEYFSKENGTLDYEAYDDSKFSVTLMSGLPASGKDTWVLKNFSKHEVIS